MRQASEHTPAEVEKAVAEILAGPEFKKKPSLLEELLRDLDFDISGIASVGRPVAILFSAIAVALVVFLLVRWMRRAQEEKDAQVASAVEEEASAARVRALLAKATEARAAGDLRAALRAYVGALILGLAEGEGLRYHPAWTNRELLGRGEPSPLVRRALEPIVGEFEPKEFGREAIEEADLSHLASLCDELLKPLLRGPSSRPRTRTAGGAR